MLAATKQPTSFFYGILALLLVSFAAAIGTDSYLLAALPIATVSLLLAIMDVRLVLYAFFLIIPFSIEYTIGSFGTDLPSEPIMLCLTVLTVILYIRSSDVRSPVFREGTTALLLLHLCWILFTALLSQNLVLSIKYFIAKTWYILPFYFLPFVLLKKVSEQKRVLWLVTISLLIAALIVLVRHYGYGFSFRTYNKVVTPIFRNHVTYAAMIVVVMPLTWALLKNTASRTLQRLLWVVLVVFCIATYFSYTRAAQGCILLMVGSFYILKYKLTKSVLILSTVAVIGLSLFMVGNNKYLDFAPNYERTITHHSYDNLVEATIKLEDISTMERVYRWVSGGYMIGERPLIGFGPSTFYTHYVKYSVTDFKTYVSDNPEKSGIHNYYLMIAVEQGIIGLMIFICLLFYILIKGEDVYHRLKDSKEKYFVAGAWLSILCVSILQLMNDLLEVDKIGPFFLLSMALICILDAKNNS